MRWRTSRRRALSLLTLVTLPLTAVVAVSDSAQASVPAPPAGFTLTWSDDFNGAAGTGIDQSLWKYDTGPGSTFGTGEIETMTSSTSNVYYDGQSHLVLQALHSGSDARSGWTSGRVETQAATFGAAAGGVVRIESILQQPNVNTANGAGYWPAFWMLGAPLRSGVAWPGSGEIDVAEYYSRYPDRVIPFLHYAPTKYDANMTNNNCLVADPSAFHTYTLEWTNTAITISFDGKTCLTDSNWSPVGHKKPYPFNSPFMVALTQGLGSTGNDYVAGTTPLPATMKVDYVRVWS